MKKILKKIVVVSFILMLTNALIAQNKSDIDYIRKIYYKAKSDIKKAEQNKIDNFYCDYRDNNVHGGSWRAVGVFSEKIRFWYTIKNGEKNIVMITINTNVSDSKIYTELLFDNGELIFAYQKVSDIPEKRFYLKNGKVIKELGDDSDEPYAPDIENIQGYCGYLLEFGF